MADDSEKTSTSTRVGHCKTDKTDTYIGRGQNGKDMLSVTSPGTRGWLGNPFTVDEYDRETAIEKFREAFEAKLERDPAFREAVRDLHGETLGCWCQRVDEDSPACHGEVIAEWADRLEQEQSRWEE